MKHFLATALLAATNLLADAKVEPARIVNDNMSFRNAIGSDGGWNFLQHLAENAGYSRFMALPSGVIFVLAGN